MPRQRVSRGFTLVELIVVLTLLLVLASLVLPAVQQARETARRTQCRAKLSQIGLALHNDQHAHGVLPPGCVNRTGPIRNQVEGYHFGWMTQILPMLSKPLSGTSSILGGPSTIVATVSPRWRVSPSTFVPRIASPKGRASRLMGACITISKRLSTSIRTGCCF